MASSLVVTGASRGIGAAIATTLAEPDRRLCLVARNEKRLSEVAVRCREAGAEAFVFPCDVTDQDSVRRMAAQAADRVGVPDVVVNNAGSFVPGTLEETDSELFANQISVNLTSAFLVTRAFLPGMSRRGSGLLVFMGSVASIKGYPGGAAYCASKHGLLGLARAVREETKSLGVGVTTLLPGATLTPSWDEVDLPPERFMPAEDVAGAVKAAIEMSRRSVVEEILIRPQLGDL